MSGVKAEIEGVLAALCGCWNRLELSGIRALWDPDEAEPYLLPQEIADPIIGWPGFDAHWKQAAARLKRASMRVWDVHAKEIGGGLATAVYKFHWNGEIIGFDHLVGIDSRATAVFRRKNDALKFIQYIEAQSAPLLHLQRYYQMNVDPAFKR